MDSTTILAIFSTISTGLNIVQFLTFRSQIKKERAFAEQESQKAIQEKANSVTKSQQILNDLTEYIEKVNRELRDEVQQVRGELKKYVNQCTVCPNNKISKP